MSCAHVIGNDAAMVVAAQSGNFQLNTMLPLMAWNLLTSTRILSNAATALGEKAIAGFEVHRDHIAEVASRNPILATALAPRIGYEAAAEIAQEVQATGRSVLDIAVERTGLPTGEVQELLDPARMTK